MSGDIDDIDFADMETDDPDDDEEAAATPANGVYTGTLRPISRAGVITVTNRDGIELFSLESGDGSSRTVTIQDLYKEKTQWFEPLADNYKKLIRTAEGVEDSESVKPFTWEQIVEFAMDYRSMYLYHKWLPGNWKKSPEGGDGYLLVSVDGMPYWGDAVGQIPFAINCFNYELIRNYRIIVRDAILGALERGRAHGDGGWPFPKRDDSDSYDNLMILRGVLWAAQRYFSRINGGVPEPPASLGNPIDIESYNDWIKR